MPKAFTPDFSNLNDTYLPRFDCAIAEYEMLIYNRWGEVVFNSQDPEIGWNGKSKTNMDAPTGLYAVRVRFKDFCANKVYVYNGTVNLIR